jgi:hypothetical protein
VLSDWTRSVDKARGCGSNRSLTLRQNALQILVLPLVIVESAIPDHLCSVPGFSYRCTTKIITRRGSTRRPPSCHQINTKTFPACIRGMWIALNRRVPSTICRCKSTVGPSLRSSYHWMSDKACAAFRAHDILDSDWTQEARCLEQSSRQISSY